jgi:hypothetical protein
MMYRLSGKNKNYLNFSEYKFGNTYLASLGISDQLLLGNTILNIGFSAMYRRTFEDELNSNVLSNTGGKWIFLVPSIGLKLTRNSIFRLVPEIPLYSYVEGTQLTSTFRIRAGIYFSLGKKIKTEFDSFL